MKQIIMQSVALVNIKETANKEFISVVTVNLTT